MSHGNLSQDSGQAELGPSPKTPMYPLLTPCRPLVVAPEPPPRGLVTARGLLLPHWGLCQKERGTGAPFSVSPDRTGKVMGAILFLVLWTLIP